VAVEGACEALSPWVFLVGAVGYTLTEAVPLGTIVLHPANVLAVQCVQVGP